jgi:hypothetical protein
MRSPVRGEADLSLFNGSSRATGDRTDGSLGA